MTITKLNLGAAYINASGKLVEKKQVKLPCNIDKCKYKCSEIFTQIHREKLLDIFWKMGDITSQRAFVVNHTSEVSAKYKYSKEGSKRLSNNSFFFPLNNTNHRVCKKMFMSTLCIGDRFIRTSLAKNNMQLSLVDMRGKHGKQKKLDPQILKSIVDHINSFPRIESHYLRKQTTREFIDGTLTVGDMYRAYIEICEKENNIVPAKLSTYSHVFNTRFNIGFFIPKKDQCGLCEQYKNSSDINKIELQNNLSRLEKNKDKELAQNNIESYLVGLLRFAECTYNSISKSLKLLL